MGKSLVIVESPSKAKTINKFLGKDFIVEATVGHIKNLPRNKINIDIENGYKPYYEVIEGKEQIIKNLKKLAKESDKVYIATDPDREGEAIASDIADEIKKVNQNIRRVLFNEITKTGIENAMKNLRNIDNNLVSSQMARRVMDRILGYKVSPFLWKSFFYGLSAGRVQSVALKLICEREEEIEKFKPKEYWSIFCDFSKLSGKINTFKGKIYKVDGNLLKFNGDSPKINNIEEAHNLIKELQLCRFKIIEIKNKDAKRNPPLPFTTSVLQQNASSVLGFSPKKTMMLAQKLYEGIEIRKGEGNIGLITYMRTDSTRISNEAVKNAESYIKNNFGNEYLSKNTHSINKSSIAQDAHEAIRPADVFITPDDLKKLDKNLVSLYELIWKRFLASQMMPAKYLQKTVIVKALSPKGEIVNILFKASGREIIFPGFLKVYDSDIEIQEKQEDDEINIMPADLKVGDVLNGTNLQKNQHFTNPPPRYTESSLIKQLDNLGIGRPSTFALIVSTVIDRKYVDLNDRKLYATKLGIKVNEILQKHFPDVINTTFTAKMEEELDTIADGTSTYKKVLDDFYNPFYKDLIVAESSAASIKKSLIEKTEILCPECGSETNAVMLKKWGKNGLFLACERYPKCKGTMSIDENNKKSENITEIKCEKCGGLMVEKIGPYGKFYGCSNYPKCNNVKPITLGINCPKCNKGEILVRKGSRKKRVFYGCTQYPDCDFIENYRPVIVNCESCNNNYMLLKSSQKTGDYLQCPKCKQKQSFKNETNIVD